MFEDITRQEWRGHVTCALGFAKQDIQLDTFWKAVPCLAHENKHQEASSSRITYKTNPANNRRFSISTGQPDFFHQYDFSYEQMLAG